MTASLLAIEPALLRGSAVRYKLRLPVIFHWNDGEEHIEGGFTRDVAVDGALIHSSCCPPLGSTVRVEVLVPSPDQDEEDLRIDCVGKVTRVADRHDCAAFRVTGIFNGIHLM